MTSSNRKSRRARAAAEKKRGSRPVVTTDRRGRVHLALHRDARGQSHVAMTVPVFREAWQNDVAVAAATTAREKLGNAPSAKGVVELGRSAMEATSKLADGLLARAPEGAVACREGCDHCCYQSVGVTPPEAFAIVDFLRRTCSAEQLAAVASNVVAACDRNQGLSSSERFSPDHPCAFLQGGRCSIYEVRPLSCRGMNSLDAGECESRLRDPEKRAAFVERGVGGRSFMEPIRAFHAVSAGVQLGLSELYGLDVRPLDLAAAVRLLLEGPASSTDDWLKGERVLEPALGGDNTTQPAAGELSGKLP